MRLTPSKTSPLRAARRGIGAMRNGFGLMLRDHRAFARSIYVRFPFLVRIRAAQIEAMRRIRETWENVLAGSPGNDPALKALVGNRARNSVDMRPPKEVRSIDVSIVTYNSERWIQKFMDSLLAQDFPTLKIRLLFVDNGSRDRTVMILRQMQEQFGPSFAGFHLIEQGNLGFGAGHDRAVRASSSDFILVTNIDIEFRKDSLPRVLETAAADRDDVAAWELRQLPFEHPKHYDPVTLETNWQSHACVLIRRNAYLRVGGYEKKIFMYGEDVELSYRFRSYGYLLRYVPSAAVHHYSYADETVLLKPLQYTGSTLANLIIRLRYGLARDRLTGFLLLIALLFRRRHPFPGARKALAHNIAFALRNATYFMRGRGPEHAHFPFRAFDFELRRVGTEYKAEIPSDSDRVTIITRTYDAPGREILLLECGRSVANQTYRNLQWLVVQDGPSAGARAVLDKIAALAPWLEVRFIECEKKGRSHNGNVGLEAATGTHCMFLDDDDLLYADHVETLIAALQRNPEAAAAYSLSFEVLATTSARLRVDEHYSTPLVLRQEWDFNTLLDHNFIPIQSIIFKRHLFLERGGFACDLEQLEDWNLWLRYGYQNTFAYVPKTTSLFYAPADWEVRLARHRALHSAYDVAKSMALKQATQL